MIKDINNCNKFNPPTSIREGTEMNNSPKGIAQLANNFFISKIIKIRNEFPDNSLDPMGILTQLIPKSSCKFTLPPITLSETIKILKNLKSSNSTGYDNVNNKILKRVKLEIAPHICHLINCIINTSIMPEIF